MKMSFSILALAFFACFLSVPIARANVVSFGDSAIYWPGWSNGTSDDTTDSIGDPNFTGGAATFSNGALTNLSFDVSDPSVPASWNAHISPGDLFISTSSGTNPNWDYVVDLTGGTVGWEAGAGCAVVGAGTYKIYAVDIPLDSQAGYILSGKDNTGFWAGFDIRDHHPVTWDSSKAPGTLVGSVYFSGWGSNPSFSDFSWNSGYGVYDTSDMTIGWAVNCANDVLYEHINSVPEPPALLLLLVGLAVLGIAGFRRKRAFSETGI